MNRKVAETRVGEKLVRYRTRIEDDPSSTGWEQRQALYRLLGTLTQVPDLLNCGLSAPQKISIYHSGLSWVVEAEATVEEG
jgi:hypothetical protein